MEWNRIYSTYETEALYTFSGSWHWIELISAQYSCAVGMRAQDVHCGIWLEVAGDKLRSSCGICTLLF